jgi:hypothetical protein
MPRIGVSITKSISFRNSTQEFSNVYYYEVLTLPDESQALTIIDNLVTLEKTFHGTDATFIRGRLWSQIGSPSQNNMLAQKNLSGTGSKTPLGTMDKERAYLFRLRAGVDSRGNPVYLRKWYHNGGPFITGLSISNAILANTSGFSQTERDNMRNAMQAIGDANGSPLTPRLCSKGGRLPDQAASWSAHQFLEHHQLGDQWRAQ